MLTAWDKARETTLALPDYERDAALAEVRARTREGELVCPTCRQPLWVHAGEVLIPHFAHRSLSNCPHGRVSEAVLGARRLLYRFFQARIESGRLPAQILLEPVIAGLPKNVRVDLLLRRAGKPAVNVVLLERGLKPDVRAQLRGYLSRKGGVFRPVFLRARLLQPEDEPGFFLLDTTQREFRLCSAYDLLPPEQGLEPGTLHFVDPAAEEWTTLRGASLAHGPQVFGARQVRVSQVEQLLWSEGHAEWVHAGEAEALRKFRQAIEVRKRRQAEERRRADEERRAAERQRQIERRPLAEQRRQAEARRAMERSVSVAPHLPPAEPPLKPVRPPPAPRPTSIECPPAPVVAPKEPEPLPGWISGGLICVGCGQRTTAWQNAAPGQDQCVCRTCFAAGVRLQ